MSVDGARQDSLGFPSTRRCRRLPATSTTSQCPTRRQLCSWTQSKVDACCRGLDDPQGTASCTRASPKQSRHEKSQWEDVHSWTSTRTRQTPNSPRLTPSERRVTTPDIPLSSYALGQVMCNEDDCCVLARMRTCSSLLSFILLFASLLSSSFLSPLQYVFSLAETSPPNSCPHLRHHPHSFPCSAILPQRSNNSITSEPMTIVGMPLASTARAIILAVWWHKGHMGTISAASTRCDTNMSATLGASISRVVLAL